MYNHHINFEHFTTPKRNPVPLAGTPYSARPSPKWCLCPFPPEGEVCETRVMGSKGGGGVNPVSDNK